MYGVPCKYIPFSPSDYPWSETYIKATLKSFWLSFNISIILFNTKLV